MHTKVSPIIWKLDLSCKTLIEVILNELKQISQAIETRYEKIDHSCSNMILHQGVQYSNQLFFSIFFLFPYCETIHTSKDNVV